MEPMQSRKKSIKKKNKHKSIDKHNSMVNLVTSGDDYEETN